MYASYAQLVDGCWTHPQFAIYRVFFYWFLKVSFLLVGVEGTGSPKFLTVTKFSKVSNFFNKQYQLYTYYSTAIANIEGFLATIKPESAIFWTKDYRMTLINTIAEG